MQTNYIWLIKFKEIRGESIKGEGYVCLDGSFYYRDGYSNPTISHRRIRNASDEEAELFYKSHSERYPKKYPIIEEFIYI